MIDLVSHVCYDVPFVDSLVEQSRSHRQMTGIKSIKGFSSL